jgi:hypothetical protein
MICFEALLTMWHPLYGFYIFNSTNCCKNVTYLKVNSFCIVLLCSKKRYGCVLQNPDIPIVPACVTMLRHLLHHDYTLRHNLSHDPAIYYDLVRGQLLPTPTCVGNVVSLECRNVTEPAQCLKTSVILGNPKKLEKIGAAIFHPSTRLHERSLTPFLFFSFFVIRFLRN